jgi:hypothetical protein
MAVTLTKFRQDLTKALPAEVLVAQWYENRGCTVQRAEGYHPDWDLKVKRDDTREFYVEVKHDFKAHQTGNFFVERKALEHSKADILVYCYGNPITHLYFLDLPKTLIRLAPFPSDTKGGDQGDYGWLFPKRKFDQILKPQVVEIR